MQSYLWIAVNAKEFFAAFSLVYNTDTMDLAFWRQGFSQPDRAWHFGDGGLAGSTVIVERRCRYFWQTITCETHEDQKEFEKENKGQVVFFQTPINSAS